MAILPGSPTPVSDSALPVLPGSPMPVSYVAGPALPGPATPVVFVAGVPPLPGDATPVLQQTGGIVYEGDPIPVTLVNGGSPWAAAVVAAGGSVSPGRLSLIDTFMAQTAGMGVTHCWLLAGENSQSALIDLWGLQTATLQNAPAFVADRGYTGNGTNAWIDTGVTPTAAYSSPNDGMFGFYIRTVGATVGIAMGCNEDANVSECLPRYTDGNNYSKLNGNVSGVQAIPNAVVGTWLVNRADANNVNVYYEKTQIAAHADAGALGLGTSSFVLLSGKNNVGAVLLPTDYQLSAAWIGHTMTPAQTTAFATALDTYLVAVGAR